LIFSARVEDVWQGGMVTRNETVETWPDMKLGSSKRMMRLQRGAWRASA
jgi:hypothetical protein